MPDDTSQKQDDPVRALADSLADTVLTAQPFLGSELGLRAYDPLLPDPSEAADDRLDTELSRVAEQARALTPTTPADVVTRDVILATCTSHQLSLQMRMDEFTVTAMPIAGPPALLAVLARATLPDAQAAADFLNRLRGSADWIDATSRDCAMARRAGAIPSPPWSTTPWPGPMPRWPSRFPRRSPAAAPSGWDGAEPGVTRSPTSLARASPRPSRAGGSHSPSCARRPSATTAGISALPGGAADYERAIAVHTTLPMTARELHEIGLAEVARLEERAVELGAGLGLGDLDAVRAAVRASMSDSIRKPLSGWPRAPCGGPKSAPRAHATAHAGAVCSDPDAADRRRLRDGAALHAAGKDGGRPGTYWFNTRRPTAGTGWDLESVAFHETVPGHHSQLARAQALSDLPLVQQLPVTVHAEGWGLYAERLAGEFGLYSDVRAQLGAVYTEMFRAARLVVDTGLHALGWSRGQARDYFTEHVALAESFLPTRSTATSRGRGRRSPTWSGSARSCGCGERPGRPWAPASTCRRSTAPCSTAARCRCRCSPGSSTPGSSPPAPCRRYGGQRPGLTTSALPPPMRVGSAAAWYTPLPSDVTPAASPITSSTEGTGPVAAVNCSP